VNLNLATVEQLDALPGVGPSTAQKIVDYRTANGGFHSVEDLKNVSGIGDAKFAALKDLVTV
jgi:competence protein ComEA